VFSQVRDGEELHNRKLKGLFIFGYRVSSKLANRIVTTELRCICVRAFESPTLHDCFYRRLAPLSRFNPAAW